jgi:hypothetical protein
MIETMGALPMNRGLECRSARMTDMRGRHPRIEVPGVDPAAVKMRRRVGGETGATHTHGATAEMGSAAAHTHGATANVDATAAKMSSAAATAEVSATAAATPEVSAATASAAKMSTTTAPATTAASRVSSSRQTKGKAYCGRARRNFPHDTPRRGHMRKPTPERPVRSGVAEACDAAMHTSPSAFAHHRRCA